MKWHESNDLQPDETQAEYEERKKAEKASTALVVLFFRFCFGVLRAIFVYCPLYYAGYLLMKQIDLENGSSDFKKILLIIFFAYVIYSLIFLLKGFLIGLKFKGNRLWIFLWGICVLATCIVPLMMTKLLLESMIEPSKRMLPVNQIITWGASILFGIYVYHQYKFKTDWAPKMVWWSYSLGFKMID